MIEATTRMATQGHSRPRRLDRQIATEYARDKVATALYEVILDGMEFGPRDLPSGEDREWIRAAIAGPLQEATEAALRVLASSLTRALERAPNLLMDRFEASHLWVELGFE
jgi:hypothetical protein